MLKRMSFLFLFLIALFTSGCNAKDVKQPSSPLSDDSYDFEVIAENLNVPWALDAVTDGTGTRFFFTERPGTIRVIANGKLLDEPVFTVPPPFIQKGEGGLLGLVADPSFATNHFLYVYHTYSSDDGIKNRVLRLVEKNNKAVIDKILLDNIPGNVNHNGGRLAIGPDGFLYITTGDALEPDLSQDKQSLAGKILRINLDGSIPTNNPFPDSPVYSLGHRNPQGIAWAKSKMFSSEHGPSSLDEINRIEPGFNYGWPIIQGNDTKQDLNTPIMHSGMETWAPSGMAFIPNGKWKGSLLVANLRGSQLLRLTLDESYLTVSSTQTLFEDQWGRIRDIFEHDDSIYILTNNRDGRGKPKAGDDKIIKLLP